MKKVILMILDGIGIAEPGPYNAFSLAKTPVLDNMLKHCPNSKLGCHGRSVGLPEEQMGNSEVGHITIGSGRVIKQELLKISDAIASQEIESLAAVKAIKNSIAQGSNFHLIGLVSDGGVHSHIDHFIALCNIFGKQNVYAHVIADGRDVPPKSVLRYIDLLISHGINIATISGRFFAMDRDQRFERTKAYYDVLIANQSVSRFDNIKDYINTQYSNSVSDEFIVPAAAASFGGIKSNDIALITNFRADRSRQIAHALIDKNFTAFSTSPISNLYTMTSYSSDLNKMAESLFEKENIDSALSEVISKAGLKQLKIAETEKYPHVTYFFNSGIEMPYDLEDRILIPSPKVATYDLAPSMSAFELLNELQNAMQSDYSLIVCNLANCDMVGHSGNIEATILAVETVDKVLGEISTAAIKLGYDMLITADHGNAEEMFDEQTNQPLTSHTCNFVWLIYKPSTSTAFKLIDGELQDIAPTILHLLGLKVPKQMTGQNLLTL